MVSSFVVIFRRLYFSRRKESDFLVVDIVARFRHAIGRTNQMANPKSAKHSVPLGQRIASAARTIICIREPGCRNFVPLAKNNTVLVVRARCPLFGSTAIELTVLKDAFWNRSPVQLAFG